MLLKRQELIEFDPANKEHRAAVRAFLKRKAWADSPIRFAHDPTFGSVADQVQAKLLQWYVDQEGRNGMKILRVPKAATDPKKLAFDMMGIASEFKA